MQTMNRSFVFTAKDSVFTAKGFVYTAKGFESRFLPQVSGFSFWKI